MMLTVSLLLNLAVLIPVCAGILTDASWASAAYGPRSPARDILLAVYLAIALLSLALLLAGNAALAAPLLAVQIVYKLATAFTVRVALRNPVVLSNLAIAAVHSGTLATLAPRLPF